MTNIIEFLKGQPMPFISLEDFNKKWGNLTNEQYLNMDYMEKFYFNMDVTFCDCKSKAQLYKRFKEAKKTYKLYNKLTGELLPVEFNNKNDIMKYLNISEDILNYLFRYSKKQYKKPKYEIHKLYSIYECRYDIIGNDYVLFDEGLYPLPKRENIKPNQCK